MRSLSFLKSQPSQWQSLWLWKASVGSLPEHLEVNCSFSAREMTKTCRMKTTNEIRRKRRAGTHVTHGRFHRLCYVQWSIPVLKITLIGRIEDAMRE